MPKKLKILFRKAEFKDCKEIRETISFFTAKQRWAAQHVFQVRKTQFHSFVILVPKTQLRSVSKFVSAPCAMPQLRILPLRTITVRKKKFKTGFFLLNRGTISIFTEQIKRRLFRRHLLIICEEEIVLDNVPSFQYIFMTLEILPNIRYAKSKTCISFAVPPFVGA